MNRFVLANALGSIDFDLLISEDITNKRGYWGETMEIRFPLGVIFVYIDENDTGFIKMYETAPLKKTEEVCVNKDNLYELMKSFVDKAKQALR